MTERGIGFPFDWRNAGKQLASAARMKNFFTSMLGALAALMIFSVGCVLLCIGFMAAIAALGRTESSPAFERGSYLVFDLSMNIADAPAPVDLGALGGQRDTVQLRTVTRA